MSGWVNGKTFRCQLMWCLPRPDTAMRHSTRQWAHTVVVAHLFTNTFTLHEHTFTGLVCMPSRCNVWPRAECRVKVMPWKHCAPQMHSNVLDVIISYSACLLFILPFLCMAHSSFLSIWIFIAYYSSIFFYAAQLSLDLPVLPGVDLFDQIGIFFTLTYHA